MVPCRAALIGIMLPFAASAQGSATSQPIALHTSYVTYAAGIHVADVEAGFSFGPWNYQLGLAWQTTGMAGLFYRGHEYDHVSGSWRGRQAIPSQFSGHGVWRGENRLAEIDYLQGKPLIRHLLPPNAEEREPVPETLQTNTIDTLSALAELIHVVADTGRCETTVHTYDGRRAVEIEAHTVGEEVLETDGRSSFSGKTLRCDFSGRMLAGFKFGDDRERDSRPMHGSAWLATVLPGGPALPVRMAFETRWFGDAIMYLAAIGQGADFTIAGAN